MINVQVERNPNENNTSIIRKFTRRVQDSGVLNRVRGLRYYERAASTYVQKKKTLKKIARKDETDTLIKLGKMKVFTRR
jgi:ribosomal protein S21